jgi:probable F420-dependent oxidoreductase
MTQEAPPKAGFGRYGVWSPQFRYAARPHIAEACSELAQAGYGAFWVTSGLGGPIFDDLVHTLEASGQARVVTGVLNIWLHGAAESSEAYQVLEERFPGRFVLGLGVSHPDVLEMLGTTRYERPYSRMLAYLDQLDDLGGPPVDRRLLAALAPRMLSLAARRTAGAHPMLTTPDHTAAARALVGAGPLLAPTVNVVLGRHRQEAQAIVRKSLGGRVRHPAYRSALLHLGFSEKDFEGGLSDRLLDSMAVMGGVEDVVAAVRKHEEAGADHVAISVLTEVPFDVESLPVAEWKEIASALGLDENTVPDHL